MYLKRFRADAQTNQMIGLLLLSVAIGMIAALAVQLFEVMLVWAQGVLLHGIAGYFPPTESGGVERVGGWGLWLIPVVTTIGGLFSGLVSHHLATEVAGGGENAVIHSFHQLGGSFRKRVPLLKMITAAVTIGSGGAAGREGPMAQISAGLASIVARPFKLSVAERRMLVIAGTAAGISAMFKSPLGAAFLAVGILYSQLDLEVEALIYSLIASSVSYAVNGFFDGWRPVFSIPPHLVFANSTDLLWYALLGVLAGVVSVIIPIVFHQTERAFQRLQIPEFSKPALGGFLVGVIGMFFPQILSVGYGWIQHAIDGQIEVQLLVLLGLLKIVAFSLTIGSGASGGVFAPVLFSGAMFGSALSLTLAEWSPDAPPIGAMAVVGMAALYAGIGRAPVATLILATELTGGYGLIVPTMVAVSLAFIVEPIFGRVFGVSTDTLYSEQVPTRLDSPTHQQEYLQMALDVVSSGGARLHGPVSLPDLNVLLEMGKPMPVGDKGEFLYVATVPDGSSAAGVEIRELPFVQSLLIVNIFRDGDVVVPRGNTALEEDDRLIIICHPSALEEFGDALEILSL